MSTLPRNKSAAKLALTVCKVHDNAQQTTAYRTETQEIKSGISRKVLFEVLFFY
jgi:hypothetical protein